MVYLSSSKFSLAVLGNMGFAVALATYKLLLRVRSAARRRLLRRHCRHFWWLSAVTRKLGLYDPGHLLQVWQQARLHSAAPCRPLPCCG